MLKTNAYFEKLRKQCEVYEEAKEVYEKRKQELIDAEGWDSENLQALYENKPEFPISAGACKAYHAWRESVRREETELELDDSLWDSEVADFVDCLREAGIETFVYTDQGTTGRLLVERESGSPSLRVEIGIRRLDCSALIPLSCTDNGT